ncbi:MAG: cation:proton antiporter [Candidatus Hydrogenedentes bacterium]|nr:cation:proton antiporter [Candidatus Hydrogenedentota bacterium]
MSDSHQLSQIVVVLGTGLVVAWLFRVVRVPTIIGFLITGIAIGPSAGRLIPPEQVSQFAELGLILLLFTVGLELSPEPLLRSGKGLLIATGAQIAVTMVVTALVLSFCSSLGLMSKAVIGLAVALSSTAIVLKQMSDRGETTSTTGLITTGILLLQDVIVIVVLLVASIASTKSGGNWRAAAAQSVGGLAGLTIIVIAARRLLPIVLMQIVRHGGRELITLFAVLMACGGAWLAALAGWSPALGACISGLLLAGADQRHQLVAEITPFRDVFNALFFISLGMSVQLSTAFAHLPILVTAILATLALKSVITAIAVRVAGWPSRLGLHVGFGLCTVSEFSYVLALQAHGMNLLPAEALDMMVVYAVGTMMLGALLYPLAAPVAVFAANRLLAGAVDAEPDPSHGGHAPFDNHVVVVGYGITGSNLCRMLKATHVPHCVVEMNQSLVQNARDAEEAVIVGDATRMSILDHAGIAKARVLVVAINDKQATQRIVGQASARENRICHRYRSAVSARRDLGDSGGLRDINRSRGARSQEVRRARQHYRGPGERGADRRLRDASRYADYARRANRTHEDPRAHHHPDVLSRGRQHSLRAHHWRAQSARYHGLHDYRGGAVGKPHHQSQSRLQASSERRSGACRRASPNRSRESTAPTQGLGKK